MNKLHFPKPFEHHHSPVMNIYTQFDEQSTFGQRAADYVAQIVGSWRFLIVQSILLAIWILMNIVGFAFHWDPYPFILMNLVLSTQAAFTAPIIMMSQNRQSVKDRLEAHHDYMIDQKTEEEMRVVLDYLQAHSAALQEIYALVKSEEE